MSFLPAGRSFAFLAFAFWNPRSVMTRWLTRGETVAAQASFKSGESLLELADFRFEDSAVWAVIFCDVRSLPGTADSC